MSYHAVPAEIAKVHDAHPRPQTRRLLSITVMLAAGIISCNGELAPLKVRPQASAGPVPEYAFDGKDIYGDYDLNDDFWPEPGGAKNSPLAGSIHEFKLSRAHDALFCSGTHYEEPCTYHSGSNDEWVKLPAHEPAPQSVEIYLQNHLQWTTFTETTQYPDETEVEWANRGQGIASDSGHWYFTNDESIYKVPLSANTNEEGQYIASASNPFTNEGFDHLGDPDYDYNNDLLIVPIQGSGQNALGTKRRFAAFSPTLQHVFHKDIRPSDPGGSEDVAAWVAINPLNGLLYTAPFDNCDRIYVYKLLDPDDPDPSFKTFVKHLYTISLDKPLSRVQGGAFSVNGHLYLASDARDFTHGIYGFQLQGRHGIHKETIGFTTHWSYVFGVYNGDEVEGLEILDLSPRPGLHPSVHGQIHLMIIDVDSWSDDFSMKHFVAADPQKL